jgi:phytoene dehydrogenase-like protein
MSDDGTGPALVGRVDPVHDRVHDVIVVGAGLAGLAAARTLHAAGRDVVVLERSDDVGGRVRSDHVDGFTLDRGFQVLLTGYPEAHRQLDLAALDLRPFEPGALVWIAGRPHIVGDPFRRPSTLFPTALAPVGSPIDKARILRLRRRVTRGHGALLLRGEDISTLEMLQREGFSQRMIDRFFRPLFSGIQLDPSLATSRRMFDAVFRSLATGESVVPAAGMSAVPRQLAEHLPSGAIRFGAEVVGVGPGEVRLADGTAMRSRQVVVAAEGPAAARLLGLPDVASRPVSCVYFGADVAPSTSHMVMLDGDGDGPVQNVAIMSNVAPTYAPPGRALIACAAPGTHGDDLVDAARRQLRGWWGAPVDRFEHLRTYHIAHGQPDQSTPFRPKKPISLGEGLWVCGDHRDTGSIQGALFSGRRCAEALLTTG